MIPNFYRVNFKPPRNSWQSGILLIIRAFGNIPPDFKSWEITIWNDLIKTSEKIIKADQGIKL